MRNPSMLTPIVSIFCLFFLLYQITLVASSTPYGYIPIDVITLDCGSANESMDRYGRDWTGDFLSKFFPKKKIISNLKPLKPQKNASSQEPLTPLHVYLILNSRTSFQSPLVQNSFGCTLTQSFTQVLKGLRPFSLSAGLFTLLRNFTAFVPDDSLQEKTFFKEFCINVGKDKKLNLTFIPFSTTFHAFINGIEIVSMPADLYYKPEGKSMEGIPDDMSLETVYRLNVAGNLISPTDDTGFFRQWSSDDNYATQAILETRLRKNTKLCHTAPDDVYRSARTMSLNRTSTRLSNLTWGLPVDMGFSYLVRLHFCEIDPNMNVVGQRRFIIYIGYLLADRDAYVVFWTDKIGTPVYKDYVVMIQKKGVEDKIGTLEI